MQIKQTQITEEVLNEWRNAVLNSVNGYHDAVLRFKENHEEEYKLITSMYRKRCVLTDCLKVMTDMNEKIYWFTLTFNNDKDTNKIETKRKDATRFLNRLSICYVIVEEYGEDNGRYHIHGFLCFKYGFGFIDFCEWHSRQKIEELTPSKIKKKIKYLTKYATKSVPRIRKSKTMSKLYQFYATKKTFRRCFESLYSEDFNKLVASVVNHF